MTIPPDIERYCLEKSQDIAQIGNWVLDLVLMDVQMPQMDGLEAARLIRSMGNPMVRSAASYNEVPILSMTANVYEEDRQNCLAAGMNDFIAKPAQPENLYRQIKKWAAKPV